MESSRPGSRLSRQLPNAYLLLALGFAVYVSARSLRLHFRVPLIDDWRLLDEMYGSALLPWIFSSQNGHRLPATLLLLYLDQTFASGRMQLLVGAAVASAWIAAAVLAVGLRRTGIPDPAPRRTLLAFAIFVLFWANGAFNFYWGANHGSVWTSLWLLLALFALALARDRRGAPGGAGLVVLALVGAVLATFGHGIGVAVWPALLAVWAVARLPWRTGAVLVAGALASVALYRAGALDPAHSHGASAWLAYVLSHAAEVPLFACAFVGAPLAWILHGAGLVGLESMVAPAAAAGAAAAVAAGVFVLLAWRRRERLPGSSLVGLGLMTFALGGGGLVGLMRAGGFGATQAVNARFLCWSALFWVGGAFVLGGIAAARGATRALTGVLAAVSFAMLPALFDAHALLAARGERLANVKLLLLLGAQPAELFETPRPPPPEMIERVTKQLAEQRRSPFDDVRYGLAGARFAERFTPSKERPCGRQPRVWWSSADGSLAGVVGLLEADARAIAYVVLADPQGVVRGLGEERSAARGAARGRRWVGMIAGVAPGKPYAAWGILRDGRSACPLGVLTSPPAASPSSARGPSA